jgi:hypothetical protein
MSIHPYAHIFFFVLVKFYMRDLHIFLPNTCDLCGFKKGKTSVNDVNKTPLTCVRWKHFNTLKAKKALLKLLLRHEYPIYTFVQY